MPRLIFHACKSAQRKTSIYSKNNGDKEPEEVKRAKPMKPLVKNLKYVDLVITWRKKTAEAKTSSASHHPSLATKVLADDAQWLKTPSHKEKPLTTPKNHPTPRRQ